MATFSDLNRVIEDTIRVDMKKRWTPQEVKFINNKNEFYGTFKGPIEASEAKLANVELSNATFYDEEGNIVDINKLLKMDGRLTDVEFGLLDLSNIVIFDVKKWIDEKVQQSQGIIEQELGYEREARISSDNKISTELNEKIDQVEYNLSSALSSEIKSRIAEDKKLETLILSVDSNSKGRFETAMSAVDALDERVDKEVETLNNRIDDEKAFLERKIELDKHYTLFDVSNGDKNYKLKDFAVNDINDNLKDGEVFFRNNIGKIENVLKNDDGSIKSLDFVTLNDFEDKDIEHCFPPFSKRYPLNEENAYTQELFDGYHVKLNRSSSELSNCTLELEKNSKGGSKVLFEGAQVGIIIDDEFSSEGTLLSGKLELVPGKDSKLSTFNGIQFTFNQDNLRYYFRSTDTGLSSKVQVIPSLSTIHLKENFYFGNMVVLRNELMSDVEVGYINQGEINPHSMTVRIVNNVGESLTGVYVLNEENGFKHDINVDFTLDYDTASKRIRLYENNKYFKYQLSTENEGGEIKQSNCFLVPELKNRTIEGNNFEQISAIFEDGEIPSFSKQTIVLKKEEGFKKVVESTSGTLEVTYDYDSRETTVKVDFVRGGSFNKTYYLNVNNYSLVEPTYRTDVVITQEVDLSNPVYEEIELNPQHEFDLVIGNHVSGSSDKKTLTIDTSKCGSITLEMPKNDLEADTSRELIVRLLIGNKTGEKVFVPVIFADDVVIENREKDDMFIQTCDKSTFLFRQMKNTSGKITYFVEDLNDKDHEHFIKKLYEMLLKEIDERKEADLKLSVAFDEKLRTEMEERIAIDTEISGKVEKNTADIADIYERIGTIVNFKGVLNLSTDYETHNGKSGFEWWFENNNISGNLSAGWFYVVESTVEPIDRHYVDGIKIGNMDFVTIKENCKVVGLLSSKVHVSDTLDSDVVHKDELCAVSSYIESHIESLSTTVDEQFFHLTGDNNVSGDNIFDGTLSVNVLSAGQIFVSFSKLCDFQTYNLSDLVKVESSFGSLYNAIEQTISIAKLDITDFDLTVNIRKAFETINKVSEKLGWSEILDLDTCLLSDGFRVLKNAIEHSTVEVNTTLRAELDRINRILSQHGNAIAELNLRLDDLSSDYIATKADFDERITKNKENIAELSGDYHKFVDNTFQENPNKHISSYNLIVTDEAHTSEPDVHKQYYMTFMDGTLVLIQK